MDPINRAPVVGAPEPVGQPTRGQDATFMAVGSDPDQDRVTWTWTITDACSDPKDPLKWPPGAAASTSDAPTTYVVPASRTSARYCVWSFATDRFGAVGAGNRTVDPLDNPPVAAILVDSPGSPPYKAYAAFQLSADASDLDNDPLTYTWSLQRVPPGSMATFTPCKGESNFNDDDTLRCFNADVSGQYVVSLAVDDGMATVQATPATLTVQPDAPPCIGMTVPPYDQASLQDSPTDPGMITVMSVEDDGDPYPAPAGRPEQTVDFTWYESKNDDPLQYVDNVNFNQLSLSSIPFKIGDFANVRVEVHDRNKANLDKILAGCGDNALCETPVGSGCFIRVSWRIQMSL